MSNKPLQTFKSKLDKQATDLIMDMLAKIYITPLQSAVREYVSNAVDANHKAGQTRPATVQLPNEKDSLLIVRDYGNGLDTFDLATIYANFGVSDKKDNNALIGEFGIGSKSGLAISDRIDIRSWKNGARNHFVLQRTPDGIMAQVLESDVPDTNTPSGTEIKINVQQNYLNNIPKTNSYVLDTYFAVLCGFKASDVVAITPDLEAGRIINENRICDTWHEYQNGYIATYEETRIDPECIASEMFRYPQGVLVGDVFYEIDDSRYGRIYKNNEIQDMFAKFTKKMDGFSHSQNFILKLDMDKTKVSYSREKILFEDPQTRDHVRTRLQGLMDEVIDTVNTLQKLNLDIDTYSQKLEAKGIATAIEFKSDYTKFLWFNSTYDLTDIQQTANSAVLLASSIVYRSIEVLIRSDVETHLNLYNERKIFVALDDNKNIYKPNTLARLIQTICDAPIDKIKDVNPASDVLIKAIKFKNHVFGNDDIYITLVHRSALMRVPSALRKDVVEYSDLVDIRRLVQPKSTKAKADKPVYLIESRYRTSKYKLEDMRVSQSHVVIMPKSDVFKFNTRNKSDGINLFFACGFGESKTLIDANGHDIDDIKAKYPNASTPSEAELISQIAEKINAYRWLAEDEMALQFVKLNKHMRVDDTGSRVDMIKNLFGIEFDEWYGIDQRIREICCWLNHIDNNVIEHAAVFKAALDALPKSTSVHKSIMTDVGRQFLTTFYTRQTMTFYDRCALDKMFDEFKLEYADLVNEMNKVK